jgi:hypothetical protein
MGGGVLFRAKNVTGGDRFLQIDRLHKRVKSAKLLRKMGNNKVIIRLVKDDKKRKWYNLKEGSASLSHGDGDYDWNNNDKDSWIPPEDKEAVDNLLSKRMDDDKMGGAKLKEESMYPWTMLRKPKWQEESKPT